MFTPEIILKGFAGLVGFKQSYNPGIPVIVNSLVGSLSGFYVNNAHPLCDIENLISVAKEFGYNVYPAWNNSTPYIKSQIVTHNSKVWRATINHNGSEPATGNPDWTETNEFSEFLQGVYEQSCLDVCTEVINQKKLKNMGKTIVDSLKMYEGAGQYYDKIIRTGRFCAIRFRLQRQDNVSVKIRKVGFQYDTAEAVTFYLYHSSQAEPIKIWTVNVTKVGSFQWFTEEDFPGFAMLTSSADYDAGGSFYFGYYEDQLSGQVIEKKFDLSRPCHSCSAYNSNAFRAWSRHLTMQAVYVKPADLDGVNMFDEATLWVTQNTNMGLNFEITVECDVSNLFVRHRSLFADALNKQIALNLIKKMAYSTRINAEADKVKAFAQGELDNSPNVASFYNDVLNTYKTLNFDFSGFSSDCLPCTNSRGITKGSI